MAEVKRLQLESAAPIPREKKPKELPPTMRFELKLEDSYEVSYRDLLLQDEAKKRTEKSGNLYMDDDEDDDKLQEIARKLEEKYNPKPGRKRKRKEAISEDYIDRGYGYDETDPFIDNGEPYDEIVPSTLTTELGGFYINTGPLKYKNLSENESSIDPKTRKKRRKQKEDKEYKKKRRYVEDHFPKKRGRKPLVTAVSALVKVKKRAQPTVADMLQQHKAQQLQQQQQQEKLQKIQLAPIIVERNIVETPEVKTEPSPQPLPFSGHILQSSICDAIESVVKASGEEVVSNSSVGAISGSSEGEERDIALKQEVELVAPKLPENLSPDLDELVKKLKEAARNSEEGKCKFFSGEVNNMLLSVELKSQELTSTQRSTIYSHLASHLPCTKETLQKRAKKLRLDQEDNKLRDPLQKLKDAIEAQMPEMIEKYEADLKNPLERNDRVKDNDVPPLTDEDTDDEEDATLPRKVFEWNDLTRKYLCDVVRIKLKCYEVTKTRIQSAEEYLKTFLRAEVKPMWPKGWMYARILLRESREAHSNITNRPKKGLMVPKKSVSPAMVCLKAAGLSSAVLTQEPNFESAIQAERCVPSTPIQFSSLDKMTDLKPSSDEINQADLLKLLTYPIKSHSSQVCSEVKTEPTPFKNVTTSPSTIKITNEQQHIVTPQPSIKQSGISLLKTPEVNNYADGSLAHDMLASIIRASLADFPYAGSNSENIASKNKSVITSSANFSPIKDSRVSNLKITNELYANQQKLEDPKQILVESKKTSQEFGSHLPIGGTMESQLNSRVAIKNDPNNLLLANKIFPLGAEKFPMNVKLRFDSRQFEEAFQRNEPMKKKGVPPHVKGMVSHSRPFSGASSLHPSTGIVTNESPSSASSRTVIENSQITSQDLAAQLNVGAVTKVSSSTPYKKRSKYAQSGKTLEQWNLLIDAGPSPTLLEGMKGFPFPVSTLPSPPPAHCSAPLKSTSPIKESSYSVYSQQGPRSSSVLSTGALMRGDNKPSYSHEPEPSNNVHLPLVDSSRRHSLLKGPWKASSSSQASSTNPFLINHSLLTQPKSTSPSVCTTTMHQNPTIVYAPSHSTSTPTEKSLFSPNQSVSVNSPVQNQPSPSSPHLNQSSFLVHHSGHSVSAQQLPVQSRSGTQFVHLQPSSIANSLLGNFTFTQEPKPTPRTK